MCWQCDHPNATLADYLKLVREVIVADGWFVQHVAKGRWSPCFSYTVGLTEIGCPELLVTGLAPRKAQQVLHASAHDLAYHRPERFVAGQVISWPDVTLEVVDVAEPTVHLVMAKAIYGPVLRAVQLVYTDDRGHWPWRVGFRGNQSVLGPRANAETDRQ